MLEMIKKLFLIPFLSVLVISNFALAQSVDSDNSSEAKKLQLLELTRLLKLRLGTDNIEEPTETGIQGVYETRFGDKFAYLIENGRYVFIGDLIDLESAHNITETSRRGLIIDKIAEIPSSDMVVFPAVSNEKTILNVFTDVSCGYCKKLHEEVHFLQEAGITVRYLPYPRGGDRGPGYAGLKQVWCSDDRQLAMSIAKGTERGELGSADCAAASMVDRGFALGNTLGVAGTPSLFTSDGENINGYMPHERLISKLLENI
ncbi:MAG: thiol:disulfide interchange protein DsbC [Gammaproteobacteria bacterium]|jgi:thiol:disulfide interchange protein DsbC